MGWSSRGGTLTECFKLYVDAGAVGNVDLQYDGFVVFPEIVGVDDKSVILEIDISSMTDLSSSLRL